MHAVAHATCQQRELKAGNKCVSNNSGRVRVFGNYSEIKWE